MAWKQVSKREWRVPLDPTEDMLVKVSMMAVLLGYEQWAIHFRTKVRQVSDPSALSVESLQSAWIRLRFEYPALAASLDPTTNEKVYHVPSSQDGDIDTWLHSTFVVDEDAGDATSLMQDFGPHRLPTLYYLPRSSELIFTCSHWRIDGIGTHMLMDRFFTLLALDKSTDKLPWGEEVKNLQPSLETAAGAPLITDDPIREHVQKLIDQMLQTRPNVGLEYGGDNDTLPGASCGVELTFTPESTTAIITACKEHDLSVSVAVHTATILATYAHSSDESKSLQSSGVLAQNLRPYLWVSFPSWIRRHWLANIFVRKGCSIQ